MNSRLKRSHLVSALKASYALIEKQAEAEFQEVLPLFRRRKSVLFISNSRFWTPHGFRPQALARTLAGAGVRVVWLDSMEWNPFAYQPVVEPPQKMLNVRVMPVLPGRRFSGVSRLNHRFQAAYLGRKRRELGGNPVVWVQGGLADSLCAKLPPPDVFSFFDDVGSQDYHGCLVQNSHVVTVLNDDAARRLQPYRHAIRLYSPTEIPSSFWEPAIEPPLPPRFPGTRLGYFGSLYDHYFDFTAFEQLISELPDLGFVLGGRTNPAADKIIDRLKRHPNFAYFPWVQRKLLSPFWRLLDLNILLYKVDPTQQGAFASKVLESLFFSIPSVGLAQPKTQPLSPYFPIVNSPQSLVSCVPKALATSEHTLLQAFKHFAYEMHPKHHLFVIANSLS